MILSWLADLKNMELIGDGHRSLVTSHIHGLCVSNMDAILAGEKGGKRGRYPGGRIENLASIYSFAGVWNDD